MRKINFIRILVLGLLSLATISAQNKVNETVYIKGNKFTAPLLEKWISEYSKVNPTIQIKWADKQAPAQNTDIALIIHNTHIDSLQADQKVTYVGRYALLPIASRNNQLISEYDKKRVNIKRLKDLYFQKEPLNGDKRTPDLPVTVYSGNTLASITASFATYFGYQVSDIKGKKISGDDLFLINAIKKDSTGITFNNLSYIYDTNTRQIKPGIALLPLDLKKEQREILNSNNIDKVISMLEDESLNLIPVENIGFVYADNQNQAVTDFLKWVLSDGQRFNHTFGFLNPDSETLTSQKKQIEGTFFTSADSK